MTKHVRILVVNPGSTSTKLALYRDEELLESATVEHPASELAAYRELWDQFDRRLGAVERWLEEGDRGDGELDAVVGRGGLLRPVAGGTYEVNDAMLEDARANLQGMHASNLGCALARAVADEAGVPAFVVDPVSVDEMDELARISGLRSIRRRGLAHALSIRGVVDRVCRERGWSPDERRFVVAHLGGGISICPVREGRMVDVNNANSGGPFSPQRAGTLPTQELMDLCFSGEYTEEELRRLTLREGGLMDLLGTDDAREVERRIDSGDEEALVVYRAMAYQIAKEIGAMAAVLEGDVDLVVLTGGLAASERLTGWVRERVSFLGEVAVVPEVSEMEALALGALRVLRGEEEAKVYGAGEGGAP